MTAKAVAIGILVGVVALMVWVHVRTHPRDVDVTARVKGSPSDVAEDLQVALLVIDGLTVVRSDLVLSVSFRDRPMSASLVAVLLFPLGLIALLGRTDRSAAIFVADGGGSTTIRCAGSFTPEMVGAVNTVIDRWS